MVEGMRRGGGSDGEYRSLLGSVREAFRKLDVSESEPASEWREGLIEPYESEQQSGGGAFRQAAVSVEKSQSELRAFYRRKRSQKGPASAATATAHKIARLYYSLVKNGAEYEEQGARAYEERERERIVAKLKKRAKSFGFELVAKAA